MSTALAACYLLRVPALGRVHAVRAACVCIRNLGMQPTGIEKKGRILGGSGPELE